MESIIRSQKIPYSGVGRFIQQLSQADAMSIEKYLSKMNG